MSRVFEATINSTIEDLVKAIEFMVGGEMECLNYKLVYKPNMTNRGVRSRLFNQNVQGIEAFFTLLRLIGKDHPEDKPHTLNGIAIDCVFDMLSRESLLEIFDTSSKISHIEYSITVCRDNVDSPGYTLKVQRRLKRGGRYCIDHFMSSTYHLVGMSKDHYKRVSPFTKEVNNGITYNTDDSVKVFGDSN